MDDTQNWRIFSESIITVRFAGQGMVTTDVVATSLEGWGRLCERIPAVLAQRHPAFNHMVLVPFVEAVDHGSMTARIVARLITKTPQDADAMERDITAMSDLAKQTFFDNIHRMNGTGKGILCAAVGSVVTLGSLNLLGYLGESDRSVLSNNSHSIIAQGAIYFGTQPDELLRMVGAATRDNARLTKQTIAALGPAASLSEDVVQIGDQDASLSISSAAARLVASINPDDLKPRKEIRQLHDVPISVRALDLDKKTSGWAAVISNVSPNRLRLTLENNVTIQQAGTFVGDVDVEFDVDLDGNATPRHAHLVRLAPQP